MKLRFSGYFLLVFFLLYAGFVPVGAASYTLPERLEYTASYEGPLTAGSNIPIARLFLQTRELNSPALANPLFETSLNVSSEIFPFVEERFPFRVRFRSFYRQEPFTLLALEKYKQTDELKHELTWLDGKNGKVGRYRMQGKGADLPAMLAEWIDADTSFRYYKPARHEPMNGLLDRLSMLQSLRQQQMVPGAEYRFAVTDGKRLLEYRVQVLGLDQIEFAGATQQAWKLLVNALYTKKGVTSPRHAPVHLWLSMDKPALPLRFVNHHLLGTFTVELQGAGQSSAIPPA